MLLLSRWVRGNSVDHTLLDTTSILRLIEDRFAGGRRIGGGSFDVRADSIPAIFNGSRRPNQRRLLLNPTTGQPTRGSG